ncbi:PREDICTED: epimerase family protein SDR39U1 [Nicrophorus vespilloides]|uniref:Epimerase family protein SDR39U1 n=1 Tax=Nicrophorus vespilloides TaxID=110193 RepID=A0ABM1N4N2_NICVS|nr:PREDICTED: epimerase family protein SDR39U1 [Nicrophorus vespilloides]
MSGLRGHVVVGGGTGFVGRHLCRVLRNKGYGVTVVSRRPDMNCMGWQELKVRGLPTETTAVVNLAGQNILDFKHRWTEEFKRVVWNSRISTTHTLAKLIERSNSRVSSFTVMSGVGIYEPLPGMVYAEKSHVHDFDFFSRMCLELEQAGKLSGHLNCRQIAIRSGVVLGYDGGMVKNLYLPFYLGLGGPVNPGNQPLPWIHVRDLARLICYSIENNKMNGAVNGVAPQLITNQEFSKAFAKAMNRPSWFPVPASMLKIILQEDRANMLLKGQKVMPNKAVSLGFQYIYPNIELACEDVIKPIPPDPFASNTIN